MLSLSIIKEPQYGFRLSHNKKFYNTHKDDLIVKKIQSIVKHYFKT